MTCYQPTTENRTNGGFIRGYFFPLNTENGTEVKEGGVCMHPKALQSYLTLCDPMNCCPPGSSVRGILQARTLEWVAIYFSRGSSQPRDRT